MKRNWKLIRAILREEDTKGWAEQCVEENKMLCSEAGYINAITLRSMSGAVEFLRGEWPRLTRAGLEASEVLENLEDLESTLAELDEKQVGHVSEFVFALMRKRALDRLNK